MAVRTVVYGGFTLEREVEPLPSPFPTDLAETARLALVKALLAGETPHPDQGKLRRALERFGHFWRRSGGRLPQAGGEAPPPEVPEEKPRVRPLGDLLATPAGARPGPGVPPREP